MYVAFSSLRSLAIMSVLAVTACTKQPVDWDSERSVSATAARPSLAFYGLIPDDDLIALALRAALPVPACAGSTRIARARGVLHAVWWTARGDSSVALLSARSGDDGVTWSAAEPVDTTDRGVTGCRRAPPAVAADSVSGYVHVTYGLVGAEGPGLFFAHSMDGGSMYHAPVPILYGEKLGRTSVAADGDVVAVGFEDPNSRTPRVGLALSRTMGHIFEHRLVPVSSDNGLAVRPLAAVRGRRVTIAWQDSDSTGIGATFRLITGLLR